MYREGGEWRYEFLYLQVEAPVPQQVGVVGVGVGGGAVGGRAGGRGCSSSRSSSSVHAHTDGPGAYPPHPTPQVVLVRPGQSMEAAAF